MKVRNFLNGFGKAYINLQEKAYICKYLHQSPGKSLHLQIPTDNFDVILTQTYQLILDTSG